MINVMKRGVSLILSIFTIVLLINVPVFADEGEFDFTVTNSGEVWSDQSFLDWNLFWSVGVFYDQLDAIENTEIHIDFLYDESGKRIGKITPEKNVAYQYDSFGNLIKEIADGSMLEFIYEFDDENFITYLYGFKYNGNEYIYEYFGDVIIGISKDGEHIVQYDYLQGVCLGVKGLSENNEWVDMKNNKEFIGNINPFRYVSKYLDTETGWYYDGRYYSQEYGRFIDGISDEKAQELAEIYGYTNEIVLKQYTIGSSAVSLVGARSDSNNYQINAIARVLYAESRAYHNDQVAVAFCIKNRAECTLGRFGEQNTPYDVAVSGEFDSYQGSLPADEFAQTATLLATGLYNGTMGTQPSGYNGQLFYRSVSNAQERMSFTSEYAYIDNLDDDAHKIYNISMVDYGSIDSMEDIGGLTQYSGKRNVFFDYVYPWY